MLVLVQLCANLATITLPVVLFLWKRGDDKRERTETRRQREIDAAREDEERQLDRLTGGG